MAYALGKMGNIVTMQCENMGGICKVKGISYSGYNGSNEDRFGKNMPEKNGKESLRIIY